VNDDGAAAGQVAVLQRLDGRAKFPTGADERRGRRLKRRNGIVCVS
jgi:hypothetical protein